MKTQPIVGMMLNCPAGQEKSVFTEEKYRGLAGRFVECGFSVETVLYDDGRADEYRDGLKHLDALLVWVNPVEQGRDRRVLDELLEDLSGSGLFVSSLPETIRKIGTKKVLFDLRNAEFGSDVDQYTTYEDFRARFPDSLKKGRPRVLKRYRGNGGDGVFKVRSLGTDSGKVSVLHAKRGSTEQSMSIGAFYEDFRRYFDSGGPMLNQEWNDNLTNGMVRCYMT